mmetsp:Transcript_80770/g.229577  ORF Transcript_80770/g.229577 Transcript_80770/m.229577 type:complete len:178 (-) Transcript_80770:24-557(-)
MMVRYFVPTDDFTTPTTSGIYILSLHCRKGEQVKVFRDDIQKYVTATIKSENHSNNRSGFDIEFNRSASDSNASEEGNGFERGTPEAYTPSHQAHPKRGSVLQRTASLRDGKAVKIRRVGLDDCCTPGFQFTYRTSLERLPFLQPEVHSEAAFLNLCLKSTSEDGRPAYRSVWVFMP